MCPQCVLIIMTLVLCAIPAHELLYLEDIVTIQHHLEVIPLHCMRLYKNYNECCYKSKGHSIIELIYVNCLFNTFPAAP